jgi:protoheme IX farnesyltransferase
MAQGVQLQDSVGEGQQVAPWVVSVESLSVTRILRAFVELTKPRIALLIVISTAVGYCYGAVSGFNALTLIHVLFGTGLMACGSATLNQWYERDLDAKMKRTRVRPIPSGIVSAKDALLFGIALSVLGGAELWLFTNSLATWLGWLTWFGYLFAYTPLKRVHPICTTVGALPGAMPPLIGFAAASGHLTIEAWLLFGMLFLWQFPHFHAIAWIYRKDYGNAGIKMLAAVRPFGFGLTAEIIGALVLLIPVTIAPAFLHMAGTIYLCAAIALDVLFLFFGLRLTSDRTTQRARKLLLASVIYLPLLFAALVFDSPRFHF